MSKEAMKLALEALERTLEMLEQADCSTGYCCCGSLMDGHGIGDGHGPVDGGDYYQSKAIQAARHAITALREALAQQALDKKAENARELGLDYEPAQQEPVAVWELFEDGWDSIADPAWMETLPVGTQLYAAPPAQRTWVGLTDEEIVAVRGLNIQGGRMRPYAFARAIETKLKEKNT